MISHCPHCNQELKLSDAMNAKIEQALAGLGDGKFLKLGCPNCRGQIQLKKDGSLFDESGPVSAPVAKSQAQLPTPPEPPDVSWLAAGEFMEREVVEDIPMVMVLMEEGEGKTGVVDTFEGMGYQSVVAESGEDAIERMRFVNFSAVVLSSQFEKSGLVDSVFHKHMRELPMTKRRYMYYILVGEEFHTFYDLEALAYSANLVMNINDVSYMNVILRKGLGDYEELFGPWLATLNEHGKN